MTPRLTLTIITLSLTGVLLPASAQALSCSETPIEARGEQSRYEWSAKGKARANWRSKVRRTPGLGAAYANWARAKNTEEHCMSGPAGTLCVFTGTPCIP